MPQYENEHKFSVGSFLLYMLGFLLFWEWLRPLSTFTNTDYLSIFVLFSAFLFTLSYFELSIWVAFPIKLLALAYALHSIYFPVSFFDFQWVSYLLDDLAGSLKNAFSRDWEGMTSISRTFLFLVLLWLISYLMHYWLIQARRIFLFFIITVLYVTVVDTFTMYDASSAIVRTVIIGFVLLGILRFIRIIELKGFRVHQHQFPLMWIVPLAILIAFSSVLGYFAPKAAPQWPDPVPFITAVGNQTDEGDGPGNGGGIQKIGYGTNDSRLGGPFVFDDNPVFMTTIEDLHYWRVESKEVYTGLGWDTNPAEPPSEAVQPDDVSLDSIHAVTYDDNVRSEDLTAKVEVLRNNPYPFIVYPGELQSVESEEERDYQMNTITNKLMTFEQAGESGLEEYTVNYKVPEFSEKVLKNSSTDYPAEITERYLQLPEDLPEEIQELTEDITADEEDPYGKAKAVEGYFAANGFSYNTTDVAVPGRNDDYVAQFLFESKLGYCDNFSTSMAVMLRTIGIPTRWVKGFTRGDYEQTLEDGRRMYEVTNSNAHSWVEVYFEGVGWVPFEPTQGFLDLPNFVSDYEEENAEVDAPEENDQQEEQARNEDDSTGSAGFQFPIDLDKVLTWLKWTSLTLVTLLVISGLVGFLTRKNWLHKYFLWRYRKRKDDDERVFNDAYHRLLWLLEQYGIKKRPQQTLREYALEVDRYLDTGDMRILTKKYEHTRYSNNPNQVDWSDTKELWENLIKRIRP
ncbi:transglutaminase domain-containing protein [Pseudalkalibacillus sp. R45]|uniref:transglutaminase domain-containing protein n=1 Tax=Pseudalkalibacillus sp. R45 TaxID=3457433 RepID=UPI003FCE6CAE